MQPEKEIVELWLNRKGFFTVRDINAGNRVIDILAVKQDDKPKIAHVEVACHVSGSAAANKGELLKKFESAKVARRIRQAIREYTGKEHGYEKFLITTLPDVKPEGVHTIGFDKVLFEFVSGLDRQYYSNNTLRTLQLVKFALLSSPSYAAKLAGREHGAFTSASREKFAKELFGQEIAKKIFGRKDNEELLISLVSSSTLKSPERLAAAIDKILTKRTATKFLNTLLKQRNVKTSVKPRIKDRTLQQFVES